MNRSAITRKLLSYKGFINGARSITAAILGKNKGTAKLFVKYILSFLAKICQKSHWAQAVESAGGKVPSGRIVKDIVQRIKERTQPAVPNPYHVGEVCRIIAASDPELKGKGGLWCIVSEVHEFSCTVKTYQGEITIRLDNLRLIDYSSADCEAMAKLCDRLSSVYSDDLEEVEKLNLSYLGKLERPYLTLVEERILEAIARVLSNK
jgi:hypothetical protein